MDRLVATREQNDIELAFANTGIAIFSSKRAGNRGRWSVVF